MLNEAYLGIGSNLGDREANLGRAIEFLRNISAHLTVSSFYETTPQGFRDQPLFLNAVCRLWTRLDAFQLLHEIRCIERGIGRRRTFINAPRILDIDILLYGRLAIQTPLLTIPHPRMVERGFVLVPLSEIAPQMKHPTLKKTIGSLRGKLGDSGGISKKLSRVG